MDDNIWRVHLQQQISAASDKGGLSFACNVFHDYKKIFYGFSVFCEWNKLENALVFKYMAVS